MSKRESTLRCNLIVQKLRNHKYATFKEIQDYLQRESEIQEYNFNVSKRTFQRDIQDIRSIWGFDIQYDFSRQVYFINVNEDNETSGRIMEAFDTFNALNVSERLNNSIHFDKRKPNGTELLYGILHAIKNKWQISFQYQKFWEDTTTVRVVQPYALKESKNRWYILVNDTKDETLKTFALDRMSDLEISKKKFSLPKNFSADDYFRHCFDVERPNDEEPEEVILSFEPFKGKYIKTLPLHVSQQILVDNENELRVKLNVYISYAFKQEILSHGHEVRVIKPEKLINELKKELLSALKQYES